MVSEPGNRTPVLDHGYVALIDTWGGDEQIIEAARMSTNKGFLGWGPKTVHMRECGICMTIEDEPGGKHDCPLTNKPHDWLVEDGSGVDRQVPGDEKLLSYLWTNKHYTPFEMAGLTIEVQAPIFVFREWHRHRTLSAALDDDIGIDAYNELSARYTPLPDVNYVPTVERLMINAGTTNKQAGTTQDALSLTIENAELFQQKLRETYTATQARYEVALLLGVPKELARLHIPVGRYSRMRASANLRNWLAFLTLRMDDAAQWEIRQYANEVGKLIAAQFPRTWALFEEKR